MGRYKIMCLLGYLDFRKYRLIILNVIYLKCFRYIETEKGELKSYEEESDKFNTDNGDVDFCLSLKWLWLKERIGVLESIYRIGWRNCPENGRRF